MRAKIDDKAHEEFLGDEGRKLVVTYTNDGEPYRSGFQFAMYGGEYSSLCHVELFDHEADRLLECLAKLRGRKLA